MHLNLKFGNKEIEKTYNEFNLLRIIKSTSKIYFKNDQIEI